VTADGWKDCVEHVKGIEAGMWTADEIQDDIEPLIINFGDNSSAGDDSTDSDRGNNGGDINYMAGLEPLH
jgi:hypothetical protein